jgi:DNA-binding transcriptional regulator YhcF (GntR family)
MIAMGAWLPGSRLPAVRQLEAEWSVNRQTILKAYRSLAASGLVDHKPNGSYYIAEQGPKGDFSQDRIELENLYEEILQKIRDETDMSSLAVLRILARMAESRQREKPEVAFVECSRSQAEDHAREITERLSLPVLALALDEIRGKRMRIPSHVKVVFTTSFHTDELKDIEQGGTQAVALPIEISPDLLTEIAGREKDIVFLETDSELAHRTSKDAVWMMGIKDPRVEVATDIADFLDSHLKPPKADLSVTLFLIPQKEWEHLDAKWQEHRSVRSITCRLSAPAWQIISDTLRIPFGSVI